MLTIHYTYDDARVCLPPPSKKRTIDRSDPRDDRTSPSPGPVGTVGTPRSSARRKCSASLLLKPAWGRPRGRRPGARPPAGPPSSCAPKRKRRPRRRRRHRGRRPSSTRTPRARSSVGPPAGCFARRRCGFDSRSTIFFCVRAMDGWMDGGWTTTRRTFGTVKDGNGCDVFRAIWKSRFGRVGRGRRVSKRSWISHHPSSSRVRRCQNKTERRSRFGVSGRARPAGDAARDDGGRNECDAFGSRRFAATATRGADDARRDRDEGCDRDRASIVSGVYLGGKPPEKNLPLGAGRGSRARVAHRV